MHVMWFNIGDRPIRPINEPGSNTAAGEDAHGSTVLLSLALPAITSEYSSPITQQDSIMFANKPSWHWFFLNGRLEILCQKGIALAPFGGWFWLNKLHLLNHDCLNVLLAYTWSFDPDEIDG